MKHFVIKINNDCVQTPLTRPFREQESAW